VQYGILKAFPNADLDVLLVWISMMSGDTDEAAQKAAKKFKDKRVKQFYDPQQLAGRAFAKSLGHGDKVAWDIYLFYPRGVRWQDLAPPPEAFMHQLRDSWADQSCLFENRQLGKKLTETMKLLFP
jgi:hypothetical protein